jgi:hypothetical protein
MSWYTWTTTIYYRSTVTSTTTITSTSTRPVTTSQYTTDIRDMQYAVFPGTIVAKTEVQLPHGTAYYKNYYNLAYIKVVDLWNTTNVLAFKTGANDFVLKVDRPIGIAAVYTYDRSVEKLPPPPPPPVRGENHCIDKITTCPSFDASKIRRTSDTWDSAPAGQCDGQVTVTFVREGGDSNCGAWIAPTPGTYSPSGLQQCPENNGQITCTASAGSTIIHGCAR